MFWPGTGGGGAGWTNAVLPYHTNGSQIGDPDAHLLHIFLKLCLWKLTGALPKCAKSQATQLTRVAGQAARSTRIGPFAMHFAHYPDILTGSVLKKQGAFDPL